MPQDFILSTASRDDNGLVIIKERIPKKTSRPYMLSEDRLEMLKRYRKYVNQYNDSLEKRNKSVMAYNDRVAEFIERNKLNKQAILAKSNFDNRTENGLKTKWLSTEDYNALVESQNGNMLLLPKRKYQKIRAMHERTFEVILWQYGNQLSNLRNHLKTLNTSLSVRFPKAKITATGIANLTNDGQPRILYTSRTVQNHIYRLRDAGIITDYSFHGTKKPVHFFINEAIFCMHDLDLSFDENQSITDFLTKKVRDKSEDTRTITKEILKKVENVDNHSQKSEVISFADGKNRNTHKITTKDDVLKTSNQNAGKLGARENFSKNKLSEYLRNQMLYKSEFIEALTAHHYDEYSFSESNMNRRLEIEATRGAMAREEFRELLLQLFLKIAAPIWKGMNVYYGSWHNAYVKIDD
jgi:DNA-binding transcriptional ArsR family regulator